MSAAAMVPTDHATIPQKPSIVVTKNLPKAKTIKEQVEAYFADIPMLVRVAECESHFRQYDENGEVFRGMVPQDVGVMQINERYWGENAEKLGIDLYTTQGNMQYARYLYEKQGLRPWKASSACWTKGTELAIAK